MRLGRNILIGSAATLVVVGLAAGPASAANTGDTTTTFDVNAGTLDITVPAAATIGAGGAPGTTITGQLGAVTVADTRAADPADWVASVVATDFTTGTATPAETVPATDVNYSSGAATATTGNGTFTPSGAAVPLNNTTPLTAFTHVGGTGNNSATWNPTLAVNVPLANVAGTYTGTVTHSVA
ncbi:MAG TPA: hypothetical protein VGJ07_15330 [Rugosimonospora sp.]